MLDNQGVEAIVDVAASATALAAGEIAQAAQQDHHVPTVRDPIRLSNEACGPYTVHYVFDTYAQANVTGLAGGEERAPRYSGSSSPPTMRSAQDLEK